MELNSFLFPAPASSYTVNAAVGDLLFIPRGPQQAIPCLYLPYTQGSSKLLIYFHGNAEDVGLACELLDYVRALLKVHVMAVEYPGYGIYDGSPDAEQIIEDA